MRAEQCNYRLYSSPYSPGLPALATPWAVTGTCGICDWCRVGTCTVPYCRSAGRLALYECTRRGAAGGRHTVQRRALNTRSPATLPDSPHAAR